MDRVYMFDPDTVHVTRFGIEDIQRSAFVASVIRAYGGV
jgi:hypothetical protein